MHISRTNTHPVGLFSILVPLFDPDTQMCFLCGKGDRNIQFVEISSSDPFIVEGLKYSGDQTKGACLVPKRAMDVMQAGHQSIIKSFLLSFHAFCHLGRG